MGDLWIVVAGSTCVAAFAWQLATLGRRAPKRTPAAQAFDARTGAPLVLRVDRRGAGSTPGRRQRDR